MAWTTPRTWVAGETVTANLLNIHLRDNLNALLGVTAVNDTWVDLGTFSELTIATGAVTGTGSVHSIDTESDATSDDLDTVSGGADGRLLVIKPITSARTVVAKDGTGNLIMAGDHSMDNSQDTTTFVYVAAHSGFLEIGRANSGA